jgi:hypothetical protein
MATEAWPLLTGVPGIAGIVQDANSTGDFIVTRASGRPPARAFCIDVRELRRLQIDYRRHGLPALEARVTIEVAIPGKSGTPLRTGGRRL